MDTHDIDAVVIGAGIAGATVAAHLARDRRVVLIEAEEAAGYHTTGRSAAMWILNYGPPDVRVLTGLSRGFFEHPPPGFADSPLLHQRSSLVLASEDQRDAMAAFKASAKGVRAIRPEQARALLPALRPGYAVEATLEEDAFDMDVATLHAGFLRQLRAAGGTLALRHRSSRIERRDGRWEVETSGSGVFRAEVVVNAAGAWGDEVAAQAGVATLGLVPKRRTGAIIDPAPWQVADWPMVCDVGQTWYARTEARTRLMVSPADETPMHAHDVQPEELDVAIAIDRMQQALDIEVHRVERSWAGLRTFTPDGSLAFGWAAEMPGFFWCVGQGGYGIQTSPAAGQLVADVIAGRDPGPAGTILDRTDPTRFGRELRFG
jgi:D-arginine dehydrogenase